MPLFHYKARGPGAQLIEGELEAVSAEMVVNQLVASDLVPVDVAEVSEQFDLLAWLRSRLQRGPRVKLEDLILFCRQMYTLTKAGVPLIRALRGLTETARSPAMAQLLKGVSEDLESGRDLSAAFGRYPEAFPALLSSMVQVGENTGKLDEAFFQVSEYLTLEKETRDRIKSALRYPSFVIIAIGIAIAVLTLLVIPTFEKVFAGFGAELPWATQVILAVSRFGVAYWPYILAGLLLAFWLARRYIRTPQGRFVWDRLKLRIPLAGSIILRATLTRFSRAFSMGYSAGIPLVQALGLTSMAVGNVFVGSKLDEVRVSIEKGDTLTRSARQTGMFTPLVLQMMAVGEETGAIDTMLVDVAEFYEREVDYDLKNLTSAIEPILIVVIGGMVLILALGVFLPMWDLASVAKR